MVAGVVHALCIDALHRFSKQPVATARFVVGFGIEGDGHGGATVQHRSRVAKDPTQPNLRQVHLLHHELFDELAERGFAVGPGDLGENVTTLGVDLLALSTGTLLHLGDEVVLEVTGLRNPCAQIERFCSGLLGAVLERRDDGSLTRKAGIMATVAHGGEVHAGAPLRVGRSGRPGGPLRVV